MGVRVARYDGEGLVLEAPLTLNHNHLGTAFGGSLNTLATLAGYGLLWLELQDPDCHLVIRESSISFRRPVTSDLRAICRRPPPAELTGFKEQFARKARARLTLHSTIEQDGGICVEF